jgi:hypothetical protein
VFVPCCWTPGRGGGASGLATSAFDEPSGLVVDSALTSGTAPGRGGDVLDCLGDFD